jgi:biopolymer transport protein TolR
MAYIPRKKRRNRVLHDIPLTPLVDTALTLLIIFMVASPMINNVIKVTLPRGNVQEGTGTTQDIVVYVDHANTIFFEGKSVDKQAVVTRLKEMLAVQSEDSVVFVKADVDAQYGKVIELLDSIKVGGVKHVALATQKHT